MMENSERSTTRSDSPVLFHREKGVIPRVAAVHDMCGIGDCSLTCALPILSAAGCDVEPVPTALFSSHTLFPQFVSQDTTAFLTPYLDAWKQIGNSVDAVYSGFLGSAEQVGIIERLYRDYPSALRLVDPVMGDNGSMYPTYTKEMCEAVKRLVPGADVLMPNLTEASLLTGLPYTGADPDEGQIHGLIDGLLEMGAKNVVLKGIDRGDGTLRNIVASRLADGSTHVAEQAHTKLPFMLHGTGDAFASALSAALLTGRSVAESADIAGEFVRACMADTPAQPDYQRRGVSIELELGRMTALLG
jgi:pyridoxine kinase